MQNARSTLTRSIADIFTRLAPDTQWLPAGVRYKCRSHLHADFYSSSTSTTSTTISMHLPGAFLLTFGVASAGTINLPAGSGPFGTSLVVTNFTDDTRNDPYAPNKTARNLMLSVFAPVQRESCQNITTHYMPALSAAFYDQVYAPLTTNGSFEAFQMSVCSRSDKTSVSIHLRKTNA